MTYVAEPTGGQFELSYISDSNIPIPITVCLIGRPIGIILLSIVYL